MARAYHVLQRLQVEDFDLPNVTTLSEAERDVQAEAFFNRLPIDVRHKGDRAYYRPSTDSVHLPELGLFKDANGYNATRGHESIHAPVRSTVSTAISLVASVRNPTPSRSLWLSLQPLSFAPTWVVTGAPSGSCWLNRILAEVLKGDTRVIFTAAGKGQAAVDWLHGQQEATP